MLKTNAIVENYGHVIINEYHHLSAVSFEAVLKRVRARYVMGLTAQPARMPQRLEVAEKSVSTNLHIQENTPIQTIFHQLAGNDTRG